ncbi:NAD-dependent epimerase/dehydratase family protein [Ruegeria marina]|uniref:Uronate dehydrogenase n=1 Tax=Ruegeria marina TaxID=639004 RepID=A0A1G6XA58_9RHOB|nr:NAD(P)-dependent oxidoreductase [Ruegeria marina]SDD75070.1 uronate dehydrogenase [Ruegeria marina]
MAKLKRLLITGAAGALGSQARRHLAGLAEEIRLSDLVAVDGLAANEEFVAADLGDATALRDLVDGCDAVAHFGGVSTEKSFDLIERGNIRGVYNLYEAARVTGRPRIFLASSNHAIGFYRTDERLDAFAAPMADGLYGASKVYGEQLALVYWKKFGIETARVRIGSCFPRPRNRRMLSTWLSYRDLFALVERCFIVPRLGCPVIYGVSQTRSGWWDNSHVAYLGWEPQDTSEVWRAELEASEPQGAVDAPDALYQGGMFTAEPIHQE